jgi:hypothetical protein
MRLSFIRYLLVIYLGLVSVLVIDPNPLYALPLVLVLLGIMFDLRPVGVLGILGFSIFTLERARYSGMDDIWNLFLHSVIIIIPLIITLEIILTPRPYRIERISLTPLIVTSILILVYVSLIFFIPRFERIGLYLGSQDLVQVFLVISISILLFSPPLLSRGPSSLIKRSKDTHNVHEDKNE